MTHRTDTHKDSLFPAIGIALRKSLRSGYSRKDLLSDLMAGIIVGMVAIPLGMSLAIATGLPPQYGLYTVIVGGAIAALLGGSPCQVSGPTAAFIVILVPIVHKYGLAGLLTAGAMAGVILILMGVVRAGKYIQFIPYPVTTGFTAGIALVIFTIQLKDFFGLNITEQPETFFERVTLIAQSASSLSFFETGVGVITLLGLLFWPKINRAIPAPLAVIPIVTLVVWLLEIYWPTSWTNSWSTFSVATIENQFSTVINGVVIHGIPQTLPRFEWPWLLSGTQGFSLEMIRDLIGPAFVIAILAAIESLLAAVVADGMAQTRHDPDAELTAIGIANLIGPFFGAIPATGALARTATNIKFGGRSPIAAIIHSLFVLLALLLAAPIISHLPMAALAALLVVVAYNMSEIKRFKMIIKVAPRSDVLVLLTCFGLTVIFDMVVGVTTGIVLAAFLFVRRMTEITHGSVIASPPQSKLEQSQYSDDLLVYEIAGPLFFGASDRAVGLINYISSEKKGVVFLMDRVPTMDVTGLVALESAVDKLLSKGKLALFVGVQKGPEALLKKAGILGPDSKAKSFISIQQAFEYAQKVLKH